MCSLEERAGSHVRGCHPKDRKVEMFRLRPCFTIGHGLDRFQRNLSQLKGGSQWLNGNIELNASSSSRTRSRMLSLRRFFKNTDSKDGSWCRYCTDRRRPTTRGVGQYSKPKGPSLMSKMGQTS